MLTTSGKAFMKKYMAGQAGTLVGAVAIGAGDTAATLADTKLQLEFSRSAIDVISYDFSTDKLVFKCTLDETVGGSIREVGLWTLEDSPTPGTQQSQMLTSFDSATETWSAGTWDGSVTRIGVDSLKLTPALSTTTQTVLTGVNYDFSANSSADIFTFAFNCDNAFTSNIKVDFRTDSSNYYEFTVTTPTSGYHINTFTMGTASVTGAPSWSDINEIAISVTATSGGAGSVELDAIRIDDVDTITPDYTLIDRFVLVTPIVKVEGAVQDLEFSLAVSI